LRGAEPPSIQPPERGARDGRVLLETKMAFLSDAVLRIAPSATVAISRKAADM